MAENHRSDSLAELKEKFMRLLETNRDSDEFAQLFAEVDQALDAASADTDRAAVVNRAS